MLKKLKILVILVVVLAIVGGVGFILAIEAITKSAVEESLSYVLQVDVTLEKAKVSIFGGDIELHGLKVGNPAGFEASESFSCELIQLKTDLSSLRSDEPRIEVIALKKPKITLEQDGLSLNLNTLIDSASRFDSGQAKPEEEDKEQAEKSSKKFIIDLISVEDTSVEVVAPLIKKGVEFPLPTLTIKDLGKGGDKVTLAQSIVRLLQELLAKSLERGKDIIPVDFQNLMLKVDGLTGMLGEGFGKALEGLKNPGASLDKVTEGLKDGAGGLVEGLTGKAGEASEGLKEGAKSLTGGLKGLFDKKEDDKK